MNSGKKQPPKSRLDYSGSRNGGRWTNSRGMTVGVSDTEDSVFTPTKSTGDRATPNPKLPPPWAGTADNRKTAGRIKGLITEYNAQRGRAKKGAS